MQVQELPPVARSFVTVCKKCGADRYHRVLTHTSASSAKIECEVCHSKRSYQLGKPEKKSAEAKPKTTRAPKVIGTGGLNESTAAISAKTASGKTPAKRATAASKEAARLAEHESSYQSLMAKVSSEAKPYSMSVGFKVGEKIEHSKFGTGFIQISTSEQIEVIFQDQVRKLIHNRPKT